MVVVGPLPQIGQNATVNVDGVEIEALPGKYTVEKAQRFGQKISEGDLRYEDFNPFESAEALSNFLGGAGVLRMDDVEHTVNLAQPYKEALGVNAADVPVILAPQQILETLPGSNGPPVWVGEFVPSGGTQAGTRLWVCVAGTKVFTRNADGSGAWTATPLALAATPLRMAVGTFGGTLIFGYGSAATAQATSDLATLQNVQQTTGPTNIYVFAYTSDQSASYVAGGTATTNVNQVLSSTTAASGYAGAVVCGTNDSPITALAPGGGIALLFVGKNKELGEIDNAGTYRQLIPFDTQYSTNCVPLKWYLGAGGQGQRGPVVLVFTRERSLWEYQPSSQDAGSAQNVSPWANPVVRPPTAKGLPTAVQGTARWLYFTVTNSAGHSFVWRKDTWTGPTGTPANHTYLDLGVTTSNVLGVTSVTSATGNPMLFIGTGNNITSVILPRDGETELTDPNCRFTSSGYIDLSDITLGFPDELKVWYSARLVADGLAPGAQTLDVQYALDSGPLQDLGTATGGPEYTLNFPYSATCRRLSPRIYFNTNTSGSTPQLWAIVFRGSLVPIPYKLVKLEGTVSSGGFFFTGAEDLTNPQTSINKLWADHDSGLPVPFRDRWNDNYMARIIDMTEQQVTVQPDKTPETAVTLTLLLVSGPDVAGGGLFYDTPQAIYNLPTSIYG